MTATSSWRPPAPRSAVARGRLAPAGRAPAAARRVPPPALRRLRRALRRSRRPVAALLLAAATALVVRTALTGADGPGAAGSPVAVVVASQDLPAGAALLGSTTTAHLPADAVPQGALDPTDIASAAQPLALAAPVRRGEVLTDVRLAGSALLASLPPGQVALPVPVASPLPQGLIGAGSRVAVLSGGLSGGLDGREADGSGVLVRDAVVLAVDSGGASGGLLAGGSGDAVVVLAVDEPDAARVAAAASAGGVVLAVTR